MVSSALPGLVALVALATSAASDAVKVKWLESPPEYNNGVTFGLPWARGQYPANRTTFTASSANDDPVQLQSWITAYWPDDSIKWTGHAIAGSETVYDSYKITPSGPGNATLSNLRRQTKANEITVTDSSDTLLVDTGKLVVAFPKAGNALISSIKTASGKTIGKNGRLILKSQSGIAEEGQSGIEYNDFVSKISNLTISKDSTTRALITVQGIHHLDGNSSNAHVDWLPFTVRFYLYANSEAIRTVHTIIYDGHAKSDFISGLGIKFDVPLTDEELYNRHVRIAGVDGGLLHEAVQGLTGLRRDPGKDVRSAQFNGTVLPDKSTWDTKVANGLQYIPAWNDYRLTQLSSDGFNLKKRTKVGQSWVKIPGGTRAGGLAYLGGATVGGLAVGLRDFWKKYPTSLDIANAATDEGSITLWLYSPSAEPLDVRPYHDGLGEDTYAKQLAALEVTYEDFEDGYNTPYGIGRTNEIFIYGFDSTPSADKLSALTKQSNTPPVLIAEPEYLHSTKAIGINWNTPNSTSGSAAVATIETHLNFLIDFYEKQIEQRRFYGFWDYGDIQHSYDADRHTWRYDIGGYAWDNSELSPDLFFWTYFLRTGRADVYRLAEAQVRHGAEVDSYHLGNFTGLGTRHGVQHWGDSAKQVRISTPVYRKSFYYLSGGDERTGDLIHAVLEVEKAYVLVDARRKVRKPGVVYVPDPKALYLNFGTDWAGLASAYLLEWERRGPRWEEARDKLVKTAETYPLLKNAFVTGEALYNSQTGAWSPPPTDPGNNGNITISHLSGVFGVLETIDDLIHHYADIPKPFVDAWIEYCYYYGATPEEQQARYGVAFADRSLKQGHSRLTAYAALKTGNATLAARAWNEFLTDSSLDELSPDDPWKTERIGGSDVLVEIDEAPWISTNAAALYGLSAIENLAFVGGPK
ncbi:hypothetical protein K504DRAFT_456749 [Pleomassaria siparia CBS 279.74]|uniref:Glycoside hydrolase family 78 protein n=1 Tax=Pleomassaria siparia CBS 279.74 TaxID=1314801 RepID=A0A6G1KPW7_9PLEO|nr:hypothetical protein K504DRAFT_456749 [Pleomassaria siparia CBS 279.74]